MKKICVITTAHPAEDNRIYLKEIQTLLGRYKVLYITTGVIENLPNNLEVINVGYFDGSLRRRISINYTAFKQALKQDVASYHFHDFDFIIFAVLLKLIKGKPVFYDVHEDYPAVVLSRNYTNTFFSNILSGLIYLIEMFCSLFFTGAFVVNEGISKRLGGVISSTEVIANYPRKELFPSSPKKNANSDKKVIVHLGNLNNIRGAEVIFSALGIASDKNVTLKVIGEITPETYQEELRKKYPTVNFEVTGKLAYKRALTEAVDCLVGIIGYLPLPNHIEASPNKIFEYMGLGLPVLASDLPSFQVIISEGVGLTYKAENPEDLAIKIKEILDPENASKFSKLGKEKFEEMYNWDTEGKKLLKLYEEKIGK